MYTFLITQDNSIIATEKDKIIENSSLSDKLQFIVEKIYNDFDMQDFTASIFYISPISNELHNENLVLENNNYKNNYYCYKMPVDSALVKEAGNIMFNISFKKIDDNDTEDESDDNEYVRNISKGYLKVLPVNQFNIPKGSKDTLEHIVAVVSSLIEEAKENVEHYPRIHHNNWYIWDAGADEYIDTGVTALGQDGQDGNGIADAYLNDDYTLTLEFTDGTYYTTPSLKGDQGIQGEQGETGNGIANTILNSDYTLTFEFTDGTSFTTQSIRGEKGEKGEKGDIGNTGNGIASTRFNPDYSITFTFTDGTTFTTDPIRGEPGQDGIDGEKGHDGVGIIETKLNSDYTLTLRFTNGSTYTTPSIRGERGERGYQGIQGEQGEQGVAGRGIVSTFLNQDYTLSILFTDGTSYTTPSIRGEKGMTGSNGRNGQDGKDGNGITSTQYNSENGTLTFNFTNNTSYTTGDIRGAIGEQGETGNGIDNVVLNNDYTLTVNFTDGTSYTTSSIRGEQGVQGIQGEQGVGIFSVDYDEENDDIVFTLTDGSEFLINGIHGEKGEQGETPMFSIGTVTTLEPNQQATATITGTDLEPVLNLGIPKGNNGVNGVDGHSPVITANKVDGTTTILVDGNSIATINDGDTPEKGVDYWTENDKAEIIDNVVDELDDDFDNKADIIIHSANGNIVNIYDGADNVPVKKLDINIEPVQDLHGYDYPWPDWSETNVADTRDIDDTKAGIHITSNSQGIISLSGTKNNSTDYEPFLTFTLSQGTYTFSVNNQYIACLVNGTQISSTFVINDEDYDIVELVLCQMYNGDEISETNIKVQIEEGSIATPWKPFSNICPITGLTGVKVNRIGTNIWDEEWEAGFYSTLYGGKITNSTNIRCKNAIQVYPNTMYYFKSPVAMHVLEYDINDVFIGYKTVLNQAITTKANTYYIRFYLLESYGTVYNNDININYFTEHNYEPYHGEIRELSWEDEIGTVYGGQLNMLTGELIVDKTSIILDGTQEIVSINSISFTNVVEWRYDLSATPGIDNVVLTSSNLSNLISDTLQTVEYNLMTDEPSISFNNGIVVHMNVLYLTTIEDVNDYLNSFPIQVVYKLAEPQTYHLTPNQLTILLGENHIWSTASSITVDYPTDTKTYVDNINNTLSDEINNLSNDVYSDLESKVSFTDYATSQNTGVVKVAGNGLQMLTDGMIATNPASSSYIKSASASMSPIAPNRQHEAVFYGLARASGDTTQSVSNNAVGSYTDNAKKSIKKMLDTDANLAYVESSITASTNYVVGDLVVVNSVLYRVTAAINQLDVFTEGTNVEVVKIDDLLKEKVGFEDYATADKAGVVRIVGYGIRRYSNGTVIGIDPATDAQIKSGSSIYGALVSSKQHQAVFYGLATAAGDTTQSQSDNTVGTYTEDAKTAIRTMLGAVGAEDYATNNKAGVVKVADGGTYGIRLNNGGIIIRPAYTNEIKSSSNAYLPITASSIHTATFYGLAKAAGDTTQASSDNAVGSYTEEAKTAIQAMLGVTDKLSDKVDKDAIDNAGISARSYTALFSGQFSVTTASDSDWLKPHARASVTGRISKHYTYRVTVNGTEYILPCLLFSIPSDSKVVEYVGNIKLYANESGVSDRNDSSLNFVIISDLNNSNSIDVLTSTAGTYTILVERINVTVNKLPKELVYGDAYVPFEVKNNGGTYNGFSIGVNLLRNTRGTLAFGYGNTISSDFGIGIGNSNVVSGQGGLAIGDENTVSSPYAIAIGMGNSSSSNWGFSAGFQNAAAGAGSIAIGARNAASGTASVALGFLLQAITPAQFVCGKCNISSADYVEIVGNGSGDNARSNARTLDWNGNECLAGQVYVGCNADSTGGVKLVSETDYASSNKAGVVRIIDGALSGLIIQSGMLTVAGATLPQIKQGIAGTVIRPTNLHQAVFYGLAKAAGDTTQSESDNVVGTYTDNAKVAIKSMLGISEPATVTVSGTTPTIVAQANTTYICGEVVSLDFTPCASGICDVRFVSGSTATVLTLPNTVKMPEWWDGTCEANTVYEINVMDGVYGVVMTWTV